MDHNVLTQENWLEENENNVAKLWEQLDYRFETEQILSSFQVFTLACKWGKTGLLFSIKIGVPSIFLCELSRRMHD